jgi:hypothetical protein
MFPLRTRTENEEETLIGRPDISNFIVLPTFAVEIIEMLDGGQTIGEVEAVFEERFGEPVDVYSFAQDLISDYQFVHTVDGEVVNEQVVQEDHLSWVSDRVGNFFFHPVAFALYVLVFLSGLVMCLFNRSYFPVYSDVFVSSSVTVSLVVAFASGWFFLGLHEFGHLAAARSLGVGSRLALSHRMMFMVAETRMSNIVLVEPKRRYRAYFAGMGWDAALLGIGIWLQYGHDAGWWTLSAGFLAFVRMVNLSWMMALAFQFQFFMQTDIYYVFTTKFNCKNLMENTKLALRRLYRPWTEAEQEEWDGVSENEKRVISWYKWFFVIGAVWAVVMFCLFTLRQAIEFISRVYADMSKHDVLSWPFLDGVLLILITLVPFCVVVWSWVRTWRARRAERAEAIF